MKQNIKWNLDLLRETELNYETACKIIYDKTIRNQTYVLNDIRELLGVRVVTITEPVREHGGLESVLVKLKYDPPPGEPIVAFIPKLKRMIKSVTGVKTIKFLHTDKVEI
jgi:hypothetical protein